MHSRHGSACPSSVHAAGSTESGSWPPLRPALRSFAISLLLVAAVGCGRGDPRGRQAISGVVTFDGQPLGDGVVLLEPRSSDRGGTAVGATIRRGSFAVARDRGPTPGSYRVRFYSSSGVQAPLGAGQSEKTRRPMVERLPAAYNTRSELEVDVTAGGANHFRFDLHPERGG